MASKSKTRLVATYSYVETYGRFRRLVRCEDDELDGTTLVPRHQHRTQRNVFLGCPVSVPVIAPNNLLEEYMRRLRRNWSHHWSHQCRSELAVFTLRNRLATSCADAKLFSTNTHVPSGAYCHAKYVSGETEAFNIWWANRMPILEAFLARFRTEWNSPEAVKSWHRARPTAVTHWHVSFSGSKRWAFG